MSSLPTKGTSIKRLVLLISTVCALALSATADANLDDTYRATWHEVADEEAGPYDGYAGRNLARYGINLESGRVRDATRAELRDGLAVMGRMLNPAPAPVAVEYSAPAAPTSSSGCPSSMAPESGSAGYGAYNASSGAYGCYQVIPSTWSAHCSDLGRDPAGQDACAARICSAQGSGAWAASGASPC